jgi:hypothetical protein
LVGYVAGGGLMAVFVLGGPRWTAIGGAVVAVAGAIKVWLPALAIVADAPVLTNSGADAGTNVSTTSRTPILAPAPTRSDIPEQPP